MTTISLIGFMGSGKTTAGRLLAKSLSLDFIDLDYEIENRLRMRIEEIFQKYGEEFFRSVETEAIKDVLSRVSNSVIACGGGVVLREENIELLRRYTTVVYLRISVDEACRRLARCEDRPLLKGGNKREIIANLLKIREPLYLKAAHIVVDVDGKTPYEVVGSIIESLFRR